MAALSVVIPSRQRERVLAETLRRATDQSIGLDVELIVVYDGPSPERRIAAEMGDRDAVTLRVVQQDPLGPAAARNRGLEAASAAAVLFLGDDAWPTPGLLERHVRFHREHPEPTAAMLGRVVPAPPFDGSRFVRWLHIAGVQFGYGELAPGEVPATCFWTANVSAKTAFVREAGGFDEAFVDAACEDAELGVRLARAGMRLVYDPDAVAEHYHPTDLAATLDRMRRVGRAFRLLAERAPEVPMPRRPGMRHRVKAAALALPAALGLARAPTWRFLCDEALREEFWGLATPRGRRLAIGDALARLAIARERDPAPSPGLTPP